MEFEKRIQMSKGMLEENIRTPFCKWFKKSLEVIEELPEDPNAIGVKVIFNYSGYEMRTTLLTNPNELIDPMVCWVNKKTKSSGLEREYFDSGTKKCTIEEMKIIFSKSPKVFITLYGPKEFMEYYAQLLEGYDGYEGIVKGEEEYSDRKTFKFSREFFR